MGWRVCTSNTAPLPTTDSRPLRDCVWAQSSGYRCRHQRPSCGHYLPFRVVASNADGTSVGVDRIFQTLTETGRPVVMTRPATRITSSSAALNGVSIPHGSHTSVSFEYGPTTNYGFTTPAPTEIGNTFRNIDANVSGLAADTTYHFQIVAEPVMRTARHPAWTELFHLYQPGLRSSSSYPRQSGSRVFQPGSIAGSIRMGWPRLCTSNTAPLPTTASRPLPRH